MIWRKSFSTNIKYKKNAPKTNKKDSQYAFICKINLFVVIFGKMTGELLIFSTGNFKQINGQTLVTGRTDENPKNHR